MGPFAVRGNHVELAQPQCCSASYSSAILEEWPYILQSDIHCTLHTTAQKVE